MVLEPILLANKRKPKMKESNLKDQINFSFLSGVHQEFEDLVNIHISPLVYFVIWGHLREQLNRQIRSQVYWPMLEQARSAFLKPG